jgi:hypothetical protein
MKLAWLCYTYEDGETHVEILFVEPFAYHYHKVVSIVYAEIQG